MGRPGRNIIGKGEVTRTQVAFIVDRYLCDNRFFQTRALFRSEASSLISKSSLHHVPIGLMTLDEMLNGYVALKHQKLALEQERVRLDQEKFRVQNLLYGMQNVMNAYNASFTPPSPPAPAPAPATTPIYQQENDSVPSSGSTQNNTLNVSTHLTCQTEHGKQKVREVSVRVDSENVSTPLTSQSVHGKRNVHEVSVEDPLLVTRKPRITKSQENSTGNEIDDLLNMDFPDVDYVDKAFPISEIFNFDADSPMKTDLWPPPESRHGNPERGQFISDHTSTVTETTQGKEMSTQGVCFDASFAGVDAKATASPAKSCM